MKPKLIIGDWAQVAGHRSCRSSGSGHHRICHAEAAAGSVGRRPDLPFGQVLQGLPRGLRQSRGAGGRPVLNPLMFVGPARQAYVVAQQDPWLLAQLWCYCGCDRTSGHRSLLDCYRDYHGANCAICTGEALEANQLFNQGSPVEQIRDALRARFSRRE